MRGMVPALMGSTAASPDTPPGPTAGGSRLVMAGAAGLVLFSLGWAAIQVREHQSESRHLRDVLAANEQRQRARGAAERAVPPAESPAAVDRRVAEAEAAARLAAEKSAAREKELEGIIAFLREENTSAQATIERLSALQPPPDPEPAARKPVEKRRAGRP